MVLAVRLTGLGGTGRGITWLSLAVSTCVIFWSASKWICNRDDNWWWGDKLNNVDVIVVFFLIALGLMAACEEILRRRCSRRPLAVRSAREESAGETSAVFGVHGPGHRYGYRSERVDNGARFAASRAQEFFNEPVEFINGSKKLALQGRIEFKDGGELSRCKKSDSSRMTSSDNCA